MIYSIRAFKSANNGSRKTWELTGSQNKVERVAGPSLKILSKVTHGFIS